MTYGYANLDGDDNYDAYDDDKKGKKEMGKAREWVEYHDLRCHR